MKVRIHINKQKIGSNLKYGLDEPVITVKAYNSNTYGHEVEVEGPSKVVYSDKPLSCGARVWVETESAVIVRRRDTGEITRI